MTAAESGKLAAVAAGDALAFNRGIEREALRVDADGNLSQAPHPSAFGSKLTHPSITTDFSEAQLELITAVSNRIEDTVTQLEELHRFVAGALEDEVLWSASMPCMLPLPDRIPLAHYGSSNLGRLKTTYRNGLGHRYGRAMQTISAVHYNFSLPEPFWRRLADAEGETVTPEYRSRRYFDLMRNFRRVAWLPLYLFGASPALCTSFVREGNHDLQPFDQGSLYGPGATSLRSGNLGYQSDTQGGLLKICYNSLDTYVKTLAEAICTPYEPYEQLGQVKDGEYLQVNTNVLQSEAEFYTNVRAKCVPPKGTNFLKVLRSRGVEYLEVRLLDINPYLPLGIDDTQMRFLDLLLLGAVLTDSPVHDDERCAAVARNANAVVWHGRTEGLELEDDGRKRPLRDWGLEVLDTLAPIADTMDRVFGGERYGESLAMQRDKVVDPSRTPSARILADMKTHSVPFFRFAMDLAVQHTGAFREHPLPATRRDFLASLAAESVEAQRAIEAADRIDFPTYLQAHNDEYRELL